MTDKRIAELRILAKYGPITIEKLEEKMGSENSNRETLYYLEKEGLIEANETFVLTDKGKEKLKSALSGEG